jgi:hypothetical protein
MKKLKTEISLRIKNNTNLSQPVSILSALGNPYSASSSTTMFTWDLSTETFAGITSVYIGYSILPIMGGGLLSATVPLPTLSIAGVVSALNTTGLAIFQQDGYNIYATSNTYDLLGIVTL